MGLAVLFNLVACGTGSSLPADAAIADAPPADATIADAQLQDGCVGHAYQSCTTNGARCADTAGYVCTCQAGGWGWICNPAACPDESNGPVGGACTDPGLLCSTGEFSELCVAPEDVWVDCTPFSCQTTYQFPKDGDPCCGMVGGPPEASHCDLGCTLGQATSCDCELDNHWHCTTSGCPDAGAG